MAYFTQTVKPVITASKQHAGNIADTQVLFDWTAFDIPKGGARLIGMTVLYRGKDGADVSPVDFELFFARSSSGSPTSAPATLGPVAGTVQAPAAGSQPWFNDILGKVYVDASLMTNDGDLVHMNVLNQSEGDIAITDNKALHSYPGNIILHGRPESGTNVGYDKVYVAAIAKGNHNWETTLDVDGTMVTTSPNLTVATISALASVAPGDVLHDEDDNALGTVKRVDSATAIVMESNLANASANNKKVYNVNPIVLQLHLEN
jgi:hypothetical protein